jgi:protein O-GlcNAc transferase
MEARMKRLDAHYEAVTSLIDMGQHEQAVEKARQVLQQFPYNAKAHQLLAWALLEQGALDKAEAAIHEALALAPQSGDIHSTLAVILVTQGRYQEAQHHYEQSIAVEPRVAGFYTRYARFLLTRKDVMEDVMKALRYTNTALQLDPQSTEAHLVRAQALSAQWRFDEAEDSIRNALAIELRRAGSLPGGISLLS